MDMPTALWKWRNQNGILSTVMLLSLLYEASGLSPKPVYRALTDWVVLKILDGVKKGEFVPDQRLSEEDLARRFDVSRAPVRDALHRLEQLGVCERRPPRGLYLRTWTTEDHGEVLALIDALNLLAVQLSFGKLSASDFGQLEQIVEEAKQSTETGIDADRKQIQRDADFHLIIARASGSRRLVELMERLMLPCVLYVNEAHDYLQREFWVNIHGSLLDALRGGNLENAETRSISNARVIREIMFKHNSQGQSHSLSPTIVDEEFELGPDHQTSLESEVAVHQITQDPDPIHL
jgi:DNA-binding GntR family transcriptional regulator